MAPVTIDRIVSVTSEDPLHPAENLLKKEYNNKKWKCKTAGEKQAIVILQLDTPTHITSIDIGNEYSAFIEILVGRSGSPDSPYEVLLVASTLMTVQDSKYGTNGNAVRFFKEDDFSKPTSAEKWDRVKIICSQPYNKTIQYGLCFLVLHKSSELDKSDQPSSLGRFKLKSEDPENQINIGNLFARRKETGTCEPKGAAAIRAASLPGTIGISSKNGFKTVKIKEGGPASTSFSPSPKLVSEAVEKTEKKRTNTQRKDKNTSGKEERQNNVDVGIKLKDHSNKRNIRSSNEETPRKKIKPSSVKPHTNVTKPFNKLLDGVFFVISGFQNPLRGEIRSKALEMGAKYKVDWDSTCTHLVCAFVNTPKFNQVRGQGKIVKKEWIEQCHSRRMRLPWRRYALDRNDLSDPVSEDEIYEETSIPSQSMVSDHRRTLNSSGSEDTEDEIERVRERQKKIQLNDNAVEPQPSTSQPSIYDMDTEPEEIEDRPNQRLLPPLSEVFHGLKFFVSMSLDPNEIPQLKRYIIAHDGLITPTLNGDVDIVVTEDSAEAQEMKEGNASLTFIKPEWIWRCNDEDKLLPTLNFEI